jgi:hypothetical protein
VNYNDSVELKLLATKKPRDVRAIRANKATRTFVGPIHIEESGHCRVELGLPCPEKCIAADRASQLTPAYFNSLWFFRLPGFKQVHMLIVYFLFKSFVAKIF